MPGLAFLGWTPYLSQLAQVGERFVPERVGESFGVAHLGVCLWLVAVGDVLGQVLGQVAGAAASVLRADEHALGVEPIAEPRDV